MESRRRALTTILFLAVGAGALLEAYFGLAILDIAITRRGRYDLGQAIFGGLLLLVALGGATTLIVSWSRFDEARPGTSIPGLPAELSLEVIRG